MTFFQKYRLFIILSLLLAIIDGIFVTLAYTQAKQHLHEDEYKLAQDYFSTFDIAYQAEFSKKDINQFQVDTLEASNTFTAFFNTISSKFNINAALLLDDRQTSLNIGPIKNAPVIKETTSGQIQPLLTAITDYHHSKGPNSEIDIEIRSLDNRKYLYATKSMSDYFGDKAGAANLGKVVIWQDITEFYTLLNTGLKVNIYYAIVGFLIFEVLMLLVFRQISRRLKNIIEQQTVELNSRNEVLEQLVQGKPLATLLESIVLGIERTHTAELCSILLLDSEGKHLLHGAAPNLPDFYNKTINGVPIGCGVGSCGTAAFTEKRVIVEDIQSDPLWENYRELAAKANLGACWSEPIIGNNNKLLGTFAIYHHQPMAPSQDALTLIKSAAQLAAVVIQHNQANEEHLLSSRVFNAAREGIMITDSFSKIITVNPMFTEITGYSREEVVGKNPSILSSNQHSPEFYADMWHAVSTKGHWQGEVWNRKKNGQLYPEQLTISALLDKAGLPHHYVGLFSDISSAKEQQKSLELMAHYDVLTNLPNRALFADRFERSIAHTKRNDTLLAVCFLDLDNFKPINDNYGHEIGDQILIEVADRLKLALREEDTVSRQGGDEFALLLSNFTSFEQCEALLSRIHHSLAKPYLIGEETHHISASSGTTIYPIDDGDIDTLIRHADQAMYQAKLAGKNKYRLFNPGDDNKIITQHAKLEEIRLALENNEFSLFYQPKVNMKTGHVFGVEALIRWFHPEKGLIPPLSFLPILDGTPLEIEVGNWVINTALMQTDQWKQQGIELEVSINISSAHLQSPSFITQLNEALLRHPSVKPSHFQLEILESSTLGDLETIRSILQTCRELIGVNIALDDFGTGYSSLTHLRILHANTIKIDQSFIRDMLDDPNDYAIIEGIIGLSDSFDRSVIAEGVETTDHGINLLLMGCYKAQGYGISRPLPAAELLTWLEHYQPNPEWLRYGSLKLSPKETKIKLMCLATHHWYETFKRKQNSQSKSTSKWPLMNPKHCQHGAWLKRARHEQFFDDDWLQELEKAHENMHVIATSLMIKHQSKQVAVTSEELDKLRLAYEDMMIILKRDLTSQQHETI